MIVPKAPINENDFPTTCENEIRLARKVSGVQSIPKSYPVHQASHDHLWTSVLAANPTHQETSLAGGKAVHVDLDDNEIEVFRGNEFQYLISRVCWAFALISSDGLGR
jgi:hypothetical protein